MDQDVFSGFELCLSKRVVCGYEDLRNSARGRPLEVRWHGGQCILMGRDEFGMGSATDDAHDGIPFVPPLSIRAQLRDLSGKFQPRDVFSSTRGRSISTYPLQEVGAIQCGTVHTNENLVRSGLWCGNVLDL
jgi:hypothetical protein